MIFVNKCDSVSKGLNLIMGFSIIDIYFLVFKYMYIIYLMRIFVVYYYLVFYMLKFVVEKVN